jgi:hypothetical protein
MKLTVKFALIALFVSNAALCQTLFTNTLDKNNGDRLIVTSNTKGPDATLEDSASKTGILLFAAGYQKATVAGKTGETYFIDLSIVHNDNRTGCLNEYSKAILVLADKTEIECFQISETDCSPTDFKSAFALMPYKGSAATMKTNFNKLLTTEITEIKLQTTEKALDFKITKEMKPYLKSHFALIDKTIKNPEK